MGIRLAYPKILINITDSIPVRILDNFNSEKWGYGDENTVVIGSEDETEPVCG